MNILGTAATVFTSKAALEMAVKEYDANLTDAIASREIVRRAHRSFRLAGRRGTVSVLR